MPVPHKSTPASATPAESGLTSALAALVDLGDGLLDGRLLADVEAARERLRDRHCNVVVLGAFKRGKSTLVNALLGEALLPTGVLPLTSGMTLIRHGDPPRLRVRFHDGHTEGHPVGNVASFVTEALNPANRLGVETVTVETPSALLVAGLQLADTPGVASLHAHNTDAAYAALGQVDAAVCVLSAEQPLAEAELELFREGARRAGRLIFAVNKIDAVSAADRRVVIDFVTHTLREAGLLGDGEQVAAISARDGEGVGELRGRLGALARDDGAALVALSAATTARLAARELERALDLRSRALELPLEELSDREAGLRARTAELLAAGHDAAELLRRRVESMLDEEVNRPLLTLERDRREELRRRLQARGEELGALPPRRLADELDVWIDALVEREMACTATDIEQHVASALEALQRRHAETMGQLLAELHAAAAEAAGLDAAPVIPDLAIREPSRFTFKLHDPRSALDMLADRGRTAVPGRPGRRLVIRAAEARLEAMVDRHAGRLRSEFVDRVRRATNDYVRDLRDAIAKAGETGYAAISHARAIRERGEEAAAGRRGELAALRRRVQAISASLPTAVDEEAAA